MDELTENSTELIKSLACFDTPTISNAIEKLQIRDRAAGFTSNELICQFPQLKSMVGYAVTATADSTTPGDKRPPQLEQLVEILKNAPQPVVLVIKHNGLDRNRCCLVGDMFTSALTNLGCVGIVTDANARDRTGITEKTPDFHLFSAGWVASHGYPAYINFNTTVTIFGLTISPGDLLHGDHSGLVKIPNQYASLLPEKAQLVQDEEKEYFNFLQNRFSIKGLKARLRPDKP